MSKKAISKEETEKKLVKYEKERIRELNKADTLTVDFGIE